jgi:hypothetical protein
MNSSVSSHWSLEHFHTVSKIVSCVAVSILLGCGADGDGSNPHEAGGQPFDDSGVGPGDSAGPNEHSSDVMHEAASNLDASAPTSDVTIDGGLFGIDPRSDIQTVSDIQKGQLCDWMNEQLGGYGKSYTCGGATIYNNTDQAQCVKNVFTGACVLPLEKFVTCVLALAPTHGCNTQYDICYPLYACYQ